MWLLVTSLSVTHVRSIAASPRDPQPRPVGIAWRVLGNWKVEGGATLLAGDPIQPGSLLRPVSGSKDHSITLLLPDGQRVFYECFLAADCAHSFRVPSLYRKPDPLAIDLVARASAVLAPQGRSTSEYHESRLARDEQLAPLSPGNFLELKGLAASLPNVPFTYDLRPLDPNTHPEVAQKLTRNSGAIQLTVPSPGLYDVTISDAQSRPRMQVLVAALAPAEAARWSKPFNDAKAMLKQWNEENQGWPIHDIQRAYLQAVVSGVPPVHIPATVADRQGAADKSAAAEPSFSPHPGFFKGDTAVTLHSETPGATIHFTVDNSQPFANSPVYNAPHHG